MAKESNSVMVYAMVSAMKSSNMKLDHVFAWKLVGNHDNNKLMSNILLLHGEETARRSCFS